MSNELLNKMYLNTLISDYYGSYDGESIDGTPLEYLGGGIYTMLSESEKLDFNEHIEKISHYKSESWDSIPDKCKKYLFSGNINNYDSKSKDYANLKTIIHSKLGFHLPVVEWHREGIPKITDEALSKSVGKGDRSDCFLNYFMLYRKYTSKIQKTVMYRILKLSEEVIFDKDEGYQYKFESLNGFAKQYVDHLTSLKVANTIEA